MIAISTNSVEIETISFAYFGTYEFYIIYAIWIYEHLFSIFYTKYHMISDFISTVVCRSYLYHMRVKYAAFLKTVS